MVVESTDVEMKNVDSPGTTAETPEVKLDTDALTLEDIKEHARHIEKSVASKEPRFILRVLRTLVSTRKKLNPRVLRKIVSGFYTHSAIQRDALLAFIDERKTNCVVVWQPMETDTGPQFRVRAGKAAQQPLLPELDIYLHLLVLLHLLDQDRTKQMLQCSDVLMAKVKTYNRRTLDLLASKCYFYHSRVYELGGRLSEVRELFHSRLRTCTLRSDTEGQAVLLNCLLRNYIHYSLYEQAAKLASKCPFPESASNNEWARYLFYLGCIKAIQLDYTEAHKRLMQAIRKAPQYTAVGFKQTAYKMAITVELLLGDIPDRALFRQPTLRRPLAPYFQLTQAVRAGNLSLFNEVLENFHPRFEADHTYTLIIRLRHNVIKTGLRMVSASYSRISLADTAKKLQLDSPEEAEYVAAKAIRDGVIEATIDHEQGFITSKETPDIYATREPQSAFHQRINFCLAIHNQSVKAMRFPPKSYNKELESAEERREREQQDLEYAKEMADEEDDGFQ
ncbi:PSMD3 [Cordylochernes scorpioides]|uniref:PSMD3 n=2 Tax=Cordylochernes scorpioides TaxID=51811 RepID=A0ABY6KBZ2_9ARAC|nr:PSMD3 [Cordylochernes scorpioides]